MLIASALSHVTQHSSHRNRKPQKQTVHPLSYPSTLHFPKYHLLLRNISPYLKSSTNCKKAFPHPPVIAYKRNASLHDLLVHSELPENKPSDQQPTGIHKCNHPRCLTCSFLQEGQTSYTFFTTKETREITNYISCHSKNLIYLTDPM